MFQGPIINHEGSLEDFFCIREYFRGLLQNHEINFDGYSVIRRNFSGATQNFSVGFLLCKGFISLILHIVVNCYR